MAASPEELQALVRRIFRNQRQSSRRPSRAPSRASSRAPSPVPSTRNSPEAKSPILVEKKYVEYTAPSKASKLSSEAGRKSVNKNTTSRSTSDLTLTIPTAPTEPISDKANNFSKLPISTSNSTTISTTHNGQKVPIPDPRLVLLEKQIEKSAVQHIQFQRIIEKNQVTIFNEVQKLQKKGKPSKAHYVAFAILISLLISLVSLVIYLIVSIK